MIMIMTNWTAYASCLAHEKEAPFRACRPATTRAEKPNVERYPALGSANDRLTQQKLMLSEKGSFGHPHKTR